MSIYAISYQFTQDCIELLFQHGGVNSIPLINQINFKK
jgi:hypothetical protein